MCFCWIDRLLSRMRSWLSNHARHLLDLRRPGMHLYNGLEMLSIDKKRDECDTSQVCEHVGI